MPTVVIIGGGWAGCSAAVSARKAGAEEVILLERADMLLGTGLVGGIMRNNGRYTAAEEAIALGGGDMFDAVDRVTRHRNIQFPGHAHADLYDIAKIEPSVRKTLQKYEIDYRLTDRVKEITMDGTRIKSVITDTHAEIYGDVFIEATGTAGPQSNCSKYGNGCVMCIFRCPSFGPRISIAEKAGVKEFIGQKSDGSYGAMSGACKLLKESLSTAIVKELNSKGFVLISVPETLQKSEALFMKACQQYALKEFAENIILLDTGHAKLMSPYYPLEKLRRIPGLENARYEDPYAGSIGNSMRFLAITPRDNDLKVKGVENLFCAGEKAGLLGHTEAMVTGILAGHNAVRYVREKELLILPDSLAIGDMISHVNEAMETEEGRKMKYTFSGAQYFKRMKEKGLYSTDNQVIKNRVEEAGLIGIFAKPVH